MPHQYIYTMKGLGKSYGPGQDVLKDIWLSFLPGAKIGVLGLNGAGKSTVLRIMAGELGDYTGEAFASAGISVGYLPQEPQLNPNKTVKGNVEEGVAEHKGLLTRYDEVIASFNDGLMGDELQDAMDEQGHLQDKIEAVGAWDLDSRVELAMDALRLPPPRAPVTNLSGGERRRVALCRLLLQSPDLLLLDEPTNHLDAETVGWLERHLQQYAGTVVAITHDRYFLDNVAGWILELDRGEGIPWEGNYSSWLEQKQQRLAVEQKQETKRRRTLERELEWIRMSPRARQAKGKARLNAYEDLLNQDVAEKMASAEIFVPPGPRLGDVVVEATNLRKGYGERCLIQDLSFTLPPAGIVGVIGANGAGKTTLFRMITGEETPDAGMLTLGETVTLGYVDQSRELDPEKTVWEEISGGEDEVTLGTRRVASRAANATACIWPSCFAPAPTCCCSTSRPTTSTSTRCGRSKMRSSSSPAVSWSSAMTAGSSTASPPTSSPSRARARQSGSRGTIRTTKRTAAAGSVPPPTDRTGSSTAGLPAREGSARFSGDRRQETGGNGRAAPASATTSPIGPQQVPSPHRERGRVRGQASPVSCFLSPVS